MKLTVRDTFRRVLVVEDDRRVREMLLDAVPDMGFDVTSANTAEAALALLGQNEIDIAIVDLNLPMMNGLDLVEQIRARWPQVQAIVLTGCGDLDAARRAIHLDVVDFLTKPCALGDLELAIQRARDKRVLLAQHKDPGVENEQAPSTAPPDAESLEELERHHIFAALQRHRGNREQTATALGISVRKLYYRLQQYDQQGLVPDELKSQSF